MTTDEWLPLEQHYSRLPKIIAGAALVLRDSSDRVLIVQPQYRHDTWEIPGGGLDPGEHPLQTAKREVTEELGIVMEPGRLLAVDWVPPQPDGRPPLANFVFDGGTITEAWAREHIRLDRGELEQWCLADAVQRQSLLLPLLARRLTACLDAVASGGTAYLYDGYAASGTGSAHP